jgi:Calcineurin-like phosphoesterase
MIRRVSLILGALTVLLFSVASREQAAPQSADGSWVFAASGDSRNCGDVVMPGIAAGVLAHHASFYWHLGDLRAIYNFDEDMQHEPEHLAKPMTMIEYQESAWDDFIENQIVPFQPVPFFLGIGNHELVPPRTREEFIRHFAVWLDAPVLRKQRLRDNRRDHRVRAYYRWVTNGVDFINLDNATPEQFDGRQMKWIERVIGRDEKDSSVTTLVVGMHRALPDSISFGHSMNESPEGTESGRRVYAQLLHAQDVAHKHVYVLASHSHFYMANIYNTEYWRTHGGVLPGLIAGTAGAIRYSLPEDVKDASAAKTNVYGYLLCTVRASGEIQFNFQQL